jgi:DEAD/DEAH box helicase domain-containing protein
VATQVVGFKKIKFFTMENVGAGNLSLPQNEMSTTAYWLTIPATLIQSLPFSSEEKINGLFGLAYLLHHVSPLFMMCDLHDVGVSVGDNMTGESVPPRNIPLKIAAYEEQPVFMEPDFEPNIFIYDNYPGGIGLSPALFDLEKELLKHCLKTINLCPCQEGCPSCVGPAGETGKQAKQVAQDILRGLLE